MIKTTYTCDRCKNEIIDLNQVWCVGIKYHFYGGNYNNNARPEVNWCRPCMIKMGIMGTEEERKVNQPIEPPPTIEDLIREIIRKELK